MRFGVRLGVDVGEVRVGLAKSDPIGILASPIATLPRDHEESTDITSIVKQAEKLEAMEIIVGLPKLLSGKDGISANLAENYAKLLSDRLPKISVRLFDERLSTVRAHSTLRANGLKTAKHRKIIDQVAAVDILQNALDTERNTGRIPGEEVPGKSGRKEDS
ncbi:MAG: Holliday junction resolvase RuvX [Micrococcaceae bacterium]